MDLGDGAEAPKEARQVGDVAGGSVPGPGSVERLREENKRLNALNAALSATHNFYLVESARWQNHAEALEKANAVPTPSSLVCCKCGRSWNWIKRDGQCGRTDYENPCPTIKPLSGLSRAPTTPDTTQEEAKR